LGLGVFWALSAFGVLSLSTSAELARTEKRIDAAIADGAYPRMQAAASAGLRIAPLDANLYRQRGLADAAMLDPAAAIHDFRIFRYLEPNWAQPCFDEGTLWLSLGRSDYALEAWKAALARSPHGGEALYSRMLQVVGRNLEVREKLRLWARINPAYFLSFLGAASRFEFLVETDELRWADPDLKEFSPEQLGLLFSLWEERGNPEELAKTIQSRREWLPFGWRFLARHCAAQKDYRRAYEIVNEFAQKPKTPRLPSRLGLQELERTFFYHSDDVVTGLALFEAETREGKLDAALDTIRTVSKQKSAPPYVRFLEADLCARQRDWEHAWIAWSEFAASGGSR
jgi:tetratricopeptide (TPR) repeat protein